MKTCCQRCVNKIMKWKSASNSKENYMLHTVKNKKYWSSWMFGAIAENRRHDNIVLTCTAGWKVPLESKVCLADFGGICMSSTIFLNVFSNPISSIKPSSHMTRYFIASRETWEVLTMLIRRRGVETTISMPASSWHFYNQQQRKELNGNLKLCPRKREENKRQSPASSLSSLNELLFQFGKRISWYQHQSEIWYHYQRSL